MRILGLPLVVAVVAAGGFVAGQSAPPKSTFIAYGPDTKIVANELRYSEAQRTTFARGAVRIVSESSTMTADEADIHALRATRAATDLDIVLRGNVRVLVTPRNGALR